MKWNTKTPVRTAGRSRPHIPKFFGFGTEIFEKLNSGVEKLVKTRIPIISIPQFIHL
jgi:hypothetical protein